MKRIGSLTLAAVLGIATWYAGPSWRVTPQQAFAVVVPPAGDPITPIPGSPGAYHLSYFDVATAFQKSVGLYGGPGNSGGTGDALLRILDAGNFESTTKDGFVCANIYVYNDVQEQQECCSCPLSPNELLTLSVINNLTRNPLNPKESLSAGVIKIVGSEPADGADCNNTPTAVTAATFTTVAGGLKAYINHTETMASNQGGFSPPFGFITSTSVDEFAGSPLDSGELAFLQKGCTDINHADRGGSQAVGICSCTPPPPPPPPTSPIVFLGCQVKDNTTAGLGSITITPPSGLDGGDVAIIAIAFQSNTSVTPPAGQFTQISSTASGAFTQNLYWHEVTSPGDNSWTFTFGASVRAEGGVLAYAGTCLEDSTPCANPINDQSSLGQASTTIKTGASGINVVLNGETVGIFAAAENALAPFNPSGGLGTECAGNTNAALLMTNKSSAPPSEGPFTATASPISDTVGDAISLIPM